MTHDFSIFSGLAVLSIYIYIIVPQNAWFIMGKNYLSMDDFTWVTPCYPHDFLETSSHKKPQSQAVGLLPFQALLVLETDEDYVRFGIPQDRLSPILTVSSTGVQLTERQNLKLGPLPTPLSSQELEGFFGEGLYMTI